MSKQYDTDVDSLGGGSDVRRECPETGCGCYDPGCRELLCLRQRISSKDRSEEMWDNLMKAVDYSDKHFRLPSERNEYWQVINKQLEIIHQLTKERDILLSINQKTTQIMATIEEVQQAVADLQATVDTTQAAIATAIKALEDQVAAGGAATPDQLQGIIDSLKAVQSDVASTPTA